ncbi:sterol desaturase family protein [Aquimarina macrocephali]|uniref:sterol desaturase family protein n=1 Tax=Aquimarina macrocephali TaxID=666563 RepID=UPI000463C003|nr:sterol desaturase family protein [Aquimarina macrocephali]
MEYLLDKKVRLALIFGWLFIMCAIEFIIPLVKTYRSSIFKTVPNVIMTILLVVTNFIFASITLLISDWVEINQIGLLYQTDISNMYLKLSIGVIFLDFWAAYLPHRLMHKIPLLWRFHSVHHSDTMVDVTTAFRQHPLETALRIAFHLSGMIILGIPLIVLLTYLSISAFNAQIEHANIHISIKLDRFLQYFYVTPNMHKVHHSNYQPETDSNYSNIFSIWDRIFGTYKTRKDYKSIEYGLEYLNKNEASVKNLLIDIPIKTKANQKKKKEQ